MSKLLKGTENHFVVLVGDRGLGGAIFEKSCCISKKVHCKLPLGYPDHVSKEKFFFQKTVKFSKGAQIFKYSEFFKLYMVFLFFWNLKTFSKNCITYDSYNYMPHNVSSANIKTIKTFMTENQGILLHPTNEA